MQSPNWCWPPPTTVVATVAAREAQEGSVEPPCRWECTGDTGRVSIGKGGMQGSLRRQKCTAMAQQVKARHLNKTKRYDRALFQT